MFINNKYNTKYFKIIEKAKNRNNVSGYVENHHIIPRSIGGNNKSDNIVELTPREHFVCHHLLTKFTSGKDKKSMWFAFNMLSNRLHKSGKVQYSRSYQIAKQKFKSIISENNKGRYIGSNSVNYDHTIRTYYNFKTGKFFTGTSWELSQKYPKVTVTRINQNPHMSSQGWIISLDGKLKTPYINTKENNPSTDTNIYKFHHQKHGLVECTRDELKTVDPSVTVQGLTDIIKNRQNFHRGWSIGKKDRPNADTTEANGITYTFKHKSGITFTGTRPELIAKFPEHNIRNCQLGTVIHGKQKSHRRWSI